MMSKIAIMRMLSCLLVSIILVFADNKLNAQNFAPLGAEWKILKNTAPRYALCDDPGYHSIFSAKVDSQKYINGKLVNILSSGNSEMLIYEDSNRIYFYETDSFYLYMDMDLSPGDTLIQQYPNLFNPFHTSCACGPNEEYIVYGVVQKDTVVLVSGDSLEQIHLDYYSVSKYDSSTTNFEGTAFFTEKLGFNNYGIGFIGPQICHLAECCDNALLCYKEEDGFSYDFSALSSNCVYTSVDTEVKPSSIKTYPNPAQDEWHIQSEKTGTLEIYSSSGREISRTEIQAGTAQINVSEFPEGIYFYRIANEKGKVMKSGKLVKK